MRWLALLTTAKNCGWYSLRKSSTARARSTKSHAASPAARVEPELVRQVVLEKRLRLVRVLNHVTHDMPHGDRVPTTPTTMPAKKTSASNNNDLKSFMIRIIRQQPFRRNLRNALAQTWNARRCSPKSAATPSPIIAAAAHVSFGKTCSQLVENGECAPGDEAFWRRACARAHNRCKIRGRCLRPSPRGLAVKFFYFFVRLINFLVFPARVSISAAPASRARARSRARCAGGRGDSLHAAALDFLHRDDHVLGGPEFSGIRLVPELPPRCAHPIRFLLIVAAQPVQNVRAEFGQTNFAAPPFFLPKMIQRRVRGDARKPSFRTARGLLNCASARQAFTNVSCARSSRFLRVAFVAVQNGEDALPEALPDEFR